MREKHYIDIDLLPIGYCEIRIIKNNIFDSKDILQKCGITGTDAGSILGLNPYRSAFQVYHDKISAIKHH